LVETFKTNAFNASFNTFVLDRVNGPFGTCNGSLLVFLGWSTSESYLERESMIMVVSCGGRWCCWRLLNREWLGRWSALLLLLCIFSSTLFFLSFFILFLLPLSGRSSISVVATVVAHGAGCDGGG